MSRFVSAICLGLMLLPSVANAQGSKVKPKLIIPKTPPVARTPTPWTATTLGGSIGPHYSLAPFMSHRAYATPHISTLTGHIGPHFPAHLLTPSLMPHFSSTFHPPMFRAEPWPPFYPGWPPADPVEKMLEDLLNPPDVFRSLTGPAYMPPSTQQLLRQVIGFDNSLEMTILGMMEQPFGSTHARRTLGIRGLSALPGFEFGMPTAPVLRSIASPQFIGPYGSGFPAGRLLLHDPFGSGFGPGALPFGGRSYLQPFGMPSMMPGLPMNRYGVPLGSRYRLPYTVQAPKPAPPMPPDAEQRAFLRQFEKDLARIVELARSKQWTDLRKPLRRILDLPDLPQALAADLRDLDAMVTEIEGVAWLSAVMGHWLKETRAGALAPHPSLALLTQVAAFLPAACDDHHECRTLDVQVCAGDVDLFRAAVAKVASGPLPVKKDDGVSPVAVEKLLGRALSSVETLVFVRMAADRRSAEEIANVLRKSE